MKLKIIFVFSLILLLKVPILNAQVPRYKTFLDGLIKIDENLLKKESWYLNRSYMFFIGISVNKNGLVDTVVYNGRNKMYAYDPQLKIIDLPSIATRIKANKKDFISCKNEFLVFLIYLRNGDDSTIKNGDDLHANWDNLANEINNYSGKKKVVMLSPTVIYFPQRIIRD